MQLKFLKLNFILNFPQFIFTEQIPSNLYKFFNEKLQISLLLLNKRINIRYSYNKYFFN